MISERPFRRCEFPLGGLSVDAGACLRTGQRLARRLGMQAQPWRAREAKGAA
jgi:hypothetical protein